MSDYENEEGQAQAGNDVESGGRAWRSTPPGKATLTSRLGASPASIARAVVAQLKEDASAPAVQARGELDGPDVHAAAAHGTAGPGGPLPFLDEIQRAFGHHDVTGVRAHVGGQAAEASAAMGARAYAAGDDVAFAAAPDLHLAAHEAAHVVQQRAGVRLSGGVGSAGDEYERHADAVADGVVRGEFVQDLLGDLAHRGRAGGSAVQRWQRLGEERFFAQRSERATQTVPIAAGTEAEWRAELDSGLSLYHRASAFLRACYIEPTTPEGLAAAIAYHGRIERDLDAAPTHEQRVKLAKALYMREGREVGPGLSDRLLAQLVRECQPEIIDRVGRGQAAGSGATLEAADAQRVAETPQTPLGGDRTAYTMLGSGAGSLARHCAEFLGSQDPRRAEADRSVRLACHTIRGAVTALNDAAESRRDLLETIIGTALSSIPLPGIDGWRENVVGELRDAMRGELVDMLVASHPANARLDRIIRTVTAQINQARGDGIADADRRALMTTVRAELAVQEG